ncbi:MAG: hybrid sensor histidine kinase/response regulator [Phycisphaerae bacterium]|nr:hybrid sensor histidine kinase/response regulator [Phycisphaerae bacterium]
MQAQGKILTVDDDPNNITIVEELLDDDYDLKTANTGEQALEIAQDFRPDIILLDIMMPGMNGYEVCRRLREHCTLKYAKIIMISARAMAPERIEGYKAGADDYITKPFDGDEFLAKVRVYLRLKHAEEVEQMRHEVTITVMENLRTPVSVAKDAISIVSANIFSSVDTNIYRRIDSKLRHQLETAYDCMGHLEKTISNFIDISEICAGKVELQPTLFSMQYAILEVVNLLKSKTALKLSDFKIDMPTEELSVYADRQKMVKILGHLIGDIIKVAHENDSICMRVKDLRDRIGVDIEGNGRGIEIGRISELFNRSIQIENYVSSGRNNTDFELAVAKGLVELHGGRIWAWNRPEGGAVFSFEIPAHAETEITVRPVPIGAGADLGVRQYTAPD